MFGEPIPLAEMSASALETQDFQGGREKVERRKHLLSSVTWHTLRLCHRPLATPGAVNWRREFGQVGEWDGNLVCHCSSGRGGRKGFAHVFLGGGGGFLFGLVKGLWVLGKANKGGGLVTSSTTGASERKTRI